MGIFNNIVGINKQNRTKYFQLFSNPYDIKQKTGEAKVNPIRTNPVVTDLNFPILYSLNIKNWTVLAA